MASNKLTLMIDTEAVKSWLEKTDMVYVVRCKDCIALQHCRFAQGLGLDGFCSKGERREE